MKRVPPGEKVRIHVLLKVISVFHYFTIIIPSLIPVTQNCFVLSLVKIGPEKKSSEKDLLNVANVLSLSYEIRLVLGKKHVSSGGHL